MERKYFEVTYLIDVISDDPEDYTRKQVINVYDEVEAVKSVAMWMTRKDTSNIEWIRGLKGTAQEIIEQLKQCNYCFTGIKELEKLNKKQRFITSNGSEGMIIDCDKYNVEIFKNKDMEYYMNSIRYIDKATGNNVSLHKALIIDWDEESDGGKLSIKYKDRWGCEMIFIHYAPVDIQGMFDFMGRGWQVFKALYPSNN